MKEKLFLVFILFIVFYCYAQQDDPEKFIVGKWKMDYVYEGVLINSTIIEYTDDFKFYSTTNSFKNGKEDQKFESRGTYEIKKGKKLHYIAHIDEKGKRMPWTAFKIISPDQMNQMIPTNRFGGTKDLEFFRIKPEEEKKSTEISLGMTEQEVITIFGDPEKKAILGDKTIYKYKDMTVTFISGKVSDVQFN